MASVCFLLVEILRMNLLEFRLDIGMACSKFPETCEVLQPSFKMAMVDEVARRLRDERDHDAHQSTRDKLDAFTLLVVIAYGLEAVLTH